MEGRLSHKNFLHNFSVFLVMDFVLFVIFVLDKIITLSKWEKVKNEEEVDDYYLGLFSCIIEMLIEIVQGTDRINFDNLIKTRNDNKTRFFRSVFDHNDKDPIMFENGKALRSFSNNLKGLMFNDDSDSETIFSIEILKQGENICFLFHGNGFLYNMVRIISGTLIEVGLGTRDASSMTEILLSLDRSKAGKTAQKKENQDNAFR